MLRVQTVKLVGPGLDSMSPERRIKAKILLITNGKKKNTGSRLASNSMTSGRLPVMNVGKLVQGSDSPAHSSCFVSLLICWRSFYRRFCLFTAPTSGLLLLSFYVYAYFRIIVAPCLRVIYSV